MSTPVLARLGRGTWLTAVLLLAATVLPPMLFDLFAMLQATVFVVMAILALSLALTWGLGGIMCFGQATFFGLGAYAYAVGVINFGESTIPVLLSIAVPALFALVLGWFMFMGRLSDLYVGVVTLLDPLQSDELHLRSLVPNRRGSIGRVQWDVRDCADQRAGATRSTTDTGRHLRALRHFIAGHLCAVQGHRHIEMG
ncbi:MULTISPECIES: hypothetical protein [unclassified Bradyrhizobium]|uniref:hypothetical protein n=1 Tax=unclassified Bradyrhizobium TaxID=2631580 RepID=UPI00247A2357|nr:MULTISPECIES: hypothetical protein [unclassified Bradyrhizobium]WGS18570.1 hypothetical protein MTX22_28990 [Bradyrhizobium sp. ISRA463]WGS25393.1 hypothetical protein MTX19_26575 [Bradyrhizobium sp. ISRA464]